MSNPLFNSLYRPEQNTGMNNMLQAFNRFRSTFTGDPKQQVQNLLNSGQMTQAQYNQLSQMAQQFMRQIK